MLKSLALVALVGVCSGSADGPWSCDVFGCTCQGMADMYGVIAGYGFGCAPMPARVSSPPQTSSLSLPCAGFLCWVAAMFTDRVVQTGLVDKYEALQCRDSQREQVVLLQGPCLLGSERNCLREPGSYTVTPVAGGPHPAQQAMRDMGR